MAQIKHNLQIEKQGNEDGKSPYAQVVCSCGERSIPFCELGDHAIEFYTRNFMKSHLNIEIVSPTFIDNGQENNMPYEGEVEENDSVNHPKHYNSHPSGVECIAITRHMTSNLGNVVKYIWRADHKNATIEDLEKARFYLNDEIKRLKDEEN